MFTPKTDKKVAVFLAPGMEEIEALTPVDVMFRAGVPAETVSITASYEVTSSHNVTVVADRLISEINFDDYDMLVLPGGMPGTTNLQSCEPLTNAVRRFMQEGKQVAAICAAPTILAVEGLLANRKATSNPNFQHVLEHNGAVLMQDPVVVDRNLITSKGAGTALDFGLEIVRHYLGDEAVETTKTKVVYKR